MARKKIKTRLLDKPWRGAIRELGEVWDTGSGISVRAVRLASDIGQATLKGATRGAIVGVQGVTQFGRTGLKIAEEAGGVIATTVEIPVDVVYGSLQEANRAVMLLRKNVRRYI